MQWKQEAPVLEQCFMFVTLLLFSTHYSCYLLATENQDKNKLLSFFRKRITDPRFSNIWKVLFVCTKYAQSIMLLLLFVSGLEHLNTLKNLGYMIFFVVFTAYEWLYRKTSWVLSVFISFFILV